MPLETIEKVFDPRVVPPFLDLPAGMPGGRSIAAKEPARGDQRQPETGMGEVHRHLAGEGDIGNAAALRDELVRSEAEGRRDHGPQNPSRFPVSAVCGDPGAAAERPSLT